MENMISRIFIPDGVDVLSRKQFTRSALKDIGGISQKTNVVVNQNISQGNFYSISTVYIPSGSSCSVILRDIVGPSSTGSFVSF